MGKSSFSLEVTGMEELFRAFDQAPKKAKKAAKQGMYKGAGIIADALTKEVNAIKTAPFKYAKDGKKRLASPEEKEMVQQASRGISKFRDSEIEIQTSIGFQNAGYAPIVWNHANSGKRTNYKNKSGESVKPVAVVANTINSGNSFMVKQPFARKAFKQNEKAATAAIESTITKELEELFE